LTGSDGDAMFLMTDEKRSGGLVEVRCEILLLVF